MNMKYVLSSPLCPAPPSLANYDGTLAKTNKAALGLLFEKKGSNSDDVNGSTAWIIDAMALIQRIKDIPSTFGELSFKILKTILSIGKKNECSRIDFVADGYPSLSIKTAERDRRMSRETSVIRLNVDNASKKTPKQFRKFLNVSENKKSFIEFLFHHWQTADPAILRGIYLYVAHGKECYVLTGREIEDTSSGRTCDVRPVSMLHSDHEEADTKMLLHAKHAAQCHHEVTIQSDDTDVFVLCLAMKRNFLVDSICSGDVVTTPELSPSTR